MDSSLLQCGCSFDVWCSCPKTNWTQFERPSHYAALTVRHTCKPTGGWQIQRKTWVSKQRNKGFSCCHSGHKGSLKSSMNMKKKSCAKIQTREWLLEEWCPETYRVERLVGLLWLRRQSGPSISSICPSCVEVSMSKALHPDLPLMGRPLYAWQLRHHHCVIVIVNSEWGAIL